VLEPVMVPVREPVIVPVLEPVIVPVREPVMVPANAAEESANVRTDAQKVVCKRFILVSPSEPNRLQGMLARMGP